MAIKNISTPISVARSVMEKCAHNVLVGDGALKWAIDNNFQQDHEVLTPQMKEKWQQWRTLKDAEETKNTRNSENIEHSHDTIGLICMDKSG